MIEFTRRRSLGLVAGGLLAGRPAPTLAAARSFVAFGDSYTHSYRHGIPSWADQISASGNARLLVNLAFSGATTAGLNGPRTFDGQIDSWAANHRSTGLPDRTVVYFGYNDIAPDNQALSPAMIQYRLSIDRLISYGVTQGGRRMILCLLHDWSRNPTRKIPARARVLAWNQYVARLAATRANVNLFARLEDVYRNKAAYGFINVTDPDKASSATSYLYADINHFGRKGQAIIANEIRPKLL
ncbi:MAG TPA: GDSL-type esterase/lipase family protein [Geminicoccus sp.]|jgi:lysophospholipase L1-like esterase|uniref:GDSL-type esterase/lipase family protein n=1 Tax=Geminicoccus sp. TaxID=2024832 RepID=UPI002E3558E2|nr:GDSL-type esterase/lipase family protein [Geminicoccus sp.]HEX2528545.1 GDSL-type esterase/lipase family protein [Geminicoccus sp.]